MIILEATTCWPPIRQWENMPIQEGWGVTYADSGITANVGGSTPHGVLGIIIQKREANGFDPDIEGVKAYLLSVWYARDPQRFTVKPQDPDPVVETLTATPAKDYLLPRDWVPVMLASVYATATAGDLVALQASLTTFSRLAQSPRLECVGCYKLIASFVNKNPLADTASTASLRNWAFRFGSLVNGHLGRPVKPRAVVESEWAWGIS